MNAPHHPLQIQLPSAPPQQPEQDDGINLVEYWDIIVDNRWLVAAVAALSVLVGGAYVTLTKPVYETNLLIQVEDSTGSAKSLLGEAASFFDVKTQATAEMEIIRSRMIVGQAVDLTRLSIEAKPNYLPVVGSWLARTATHLSDPGFLGFGGWVTGTEKIVVEQFDVPGALEKSTFTVTAGSQGSFTLTHPKVDQVLKGTAGGPPASVVTPLGPISLAISTIQAKPGAEFTLVRQSRLATIERLQTDLKVSERGRQSGVLQATLRDTEPDRLVRVLNEIGQQYVRQNIERKAAEAQKTLSFLDVQLPQFKKQLDDAENAYNRYRNQKGTVALDEEAKLILTHIVELQGKLLESQQKRRDLVSRFTAQHPAVKTLDDQIGAWNREIASLNDRVRGMPTVQQDALRLERDVKVNNELYQQLRNNALQLQLVREGKVGNVRLIDEAALPEKSVGPKTLLVLGAALALGLFGGVLMAIGRNVFFRGIRNPQEIEAHTGLSVYSAIPLSDSQVTQGRKVAEREPGLHLLAAAAPHDPAVESLRSLRTALQFSMLEAPNNRVLITGPTPSVGKSFVSANFAAVLASAGKRVVLVDADLRKGYLNQYFGLQRSGGLSEVVAGTMKLPEALRRELIPNLDLLPTGILPPNPAELMMSRALAHVLDTLSEQYDLVIIDTPPVLAVADTLAIASHCGTLLMVARADQTQLGELNESAKRIAHAGRTINGVLFNALDLKRRHYGSYGYGRYNYRHYSYQPASK